jgi:hypothetical protein
MPSEDELPPGGRRQLVELLFLLYRDARRPTLEEISKRIRDGDYAATASKETIRKMLRGTTIPAHWATIETVVLALCDLGGFDPASSVKQAGLQEPLMKLVEQRWHTALEEPPPRVAPYDPWASDDDPWAVDASGGYSDEPPF